MESREKERRCDGHEAEDINAAEWRGKLDISVGGKVPEIEDRDVKHRVYRNQCAPASE